MKFPRSSIQIFLRLEFIQFMRDCVPLKLIEENNNMFPYHIQEIMSESVGRIFS